MVEDVPVDDAVEHIVDALDSQLGAQFASSYEYPGRYTRWDMGFVNPPIVITSRDREFHVAALNERGAILLPSVEPVLRTLPAVKHWDRASNEIHGSIARSEKRFAEEQRSRQPSVFSLLRAIVDLFYSDADPHLGLYGAFGYDLAFQFEPVCLLLERQADQRDLVLYLPDDVVVVDHRRERAMRRYYDFEVNGASTLGLSRSGGRADYVGSNVENQSCDHAPGE